MKLSVYSVGRQKNIYSTTPEAAVDGGAISTAVDLIKFSQALRKGLRLSSGMTREMLTPKAAANEELLRGYSWKYGCGNDCILDQDE
jgi:hypothetical protein